MLEFLLRQSVEDYVFYEDQESIIALNEYCDCLEKDPDETCQELENLVLSKLDGYLTENFNRFNVVLESKSMSLIKKVVAQSGGTLSLKGGEDLLPKVSSKKAIGKKKSLKKPKGKFNKVKKKLKKYIGAQLKRAKKHRIKVSRERNKFKRMRSKRSRKKIRSSRPKRLKSGTVRSRLRKIK